MTHVDVSASKTNDKIRQLENKFFSQIKGHVLLRLRAKAGLPCTCFIASFPGLISTFKTVLETLEFLSNIQFDVKFCVYFSEFW